MNVLQALRLFGPITLEQVAARCSLPQIEADCEAWRLEGADLVEICTPDPLRPVTGSLWDVTQAGRDEFEAQMDAARQGLEVAS